MTVFDPGTLNRLVDDTDSRPFVLELARTYLGLLEPRIARLTDALDRRDVDAALDAVLSLRVSSSMTGATEMAELAHVVEADLRGHDLAAARSHASLMPRAARSLTRSIESYVTVSMR